MGIPVKLNVYDLTQLNFILHPLGLGAYHTTVQIFDTEISFNLIDGREGAVIEHEPLSNKQLVFRTSLLLGESELSLIEVNHLISEAKRIYSEEKYDIFNKNCNHFTGELCRKLINKEIPCYINRLASVGKYFRCFLKDSFIKGDCEKGRKLALSKSNNNKKSKNGGTFVKACDRASMKSKANGAPKNTNEKKITTSFTVQKLSESHANFLNREIPSGLSTPTHHESIVIKELEVKNLRSDDSEQTVET
jgi:hypothetical protein